jgi:hypothetical protein
MQYWLVSVTSSYDLNELNANVIIIRDEVQEFKSQETAVSPVVRSHTLNSLVLSLPSTFRMKPDIGCSSHLLSVAKFPRNIAVVATEAALLST